MANDGRCNYNNGDHNDVQNPPSTLEQLLTVQAQLLRTMQQILAQMQDVNQLLQSMEARPSSGKRKSNTQDDDGPISKINATGKQYPITRKVLRQLKQRQRVSIVNRLVILPIDALLDVSVPPPQPTNFKCWESEWTKV
jgi:hypothetical protein